MELRLVNTDTLYFEDFLDFLCDVLHINSDVARKIVFEVHNTGFYPVAFFDGDSELRNFVSLCEKNKVPYEVIF